jgi:hypothetical protein
MHPLWLSNTTAQEHFKEETTPKKVLNIKIKEDTQLEDQDQGGHNRLVKTPCRRKGERVKHRKLEVLGF